MDTSQGLLLAIGWFVLRFGLPVIATILVCWLFKKIDERWQAEAKASREQTGTDHLGPTIRCWVLNNCSEEQMKKCPAYQEQGIPCWQHFRGKKGELKEKCLGCGIFRGETVPETGD